MPTINELLPGVEQRFCVRHLYSNWRKDHPGRHLKELMWKAANATYPEEWERIMRQIKEAKLKAFQDLVKIAPRYWSKSRFTRGPKCDTLVNNMSETFNSVIVEYREHPIEKMLEEIRIYLMTRWAENREKIKTYAEDILPRIKLRLQKEIDLAEKWMCQWVGEEIFEVYSVYPHVPDTFVVNLKELSCTCRKWLITAIPCCHAVTAIKHMKKSPEDYIPVCFRKQTYEECYSHMIFPPKGEKMRKITRYPDVLPPLEKKRTGRPKKKRTKDVNEKEDEANKKAKLSNTTPATVTRKGIVMTCSKCGQKGHNKTKCPGSMASSSALGSANQASGSIGTQATLDVSTNFEHVILNLKEVILN